MGSDNGAKSTSKEPVRSRLYLVAAICLGVIIILVGLLWFVGVVLHAITFFPPLDLNQPLLPDVTLLQLRDGLTQDHNVTSQGALMHDRTTTLWSWFADEFGSNPNSPYLWYMLPWGPWNLFYAPFWQINPREAIVYVGKLPPQCRYFSFTTFSLVSLTHPAKLPFASLGDTVNNLNVYPEKEKGEDLKRVFAHIVTGSQSTYNSVRASLIEQGFPKAAIHLTSLPQLPHIDAPSDEEYLPKMGTDWTSTYFETVLRIFMFDDTEEGVQFLNDAPTLYPAWRVTPTTTKPLLQGSSDLYRDNGYTSRQHRDNVYEHGLETVLTQYNARFYALESWLRHSDYIRVDLVASFEPLKIIGLDCLKDGSCCLGDCPDAAYAGPFLRDDTDVVRTIQLPSNGFHIVMGVNHAQLNTSVYNSIAVLGANGATLSRRMMRVKNSGIGVTSMDLAELGVNEPVFMWLFTRQPNHCDFFADFIDGCTVIDEGVISAKKYMTYCERVYLNPVTATGPDWDTLLNVKLVTGSLIR